MFDPPDDEAEEAFVAHRAETVERWKVQETSAAVLARSQGGDRQVVRLLEIMGSSTELNELLYDLFR